MIQERQRPFEDVEAEHLPLENGFTACGSFPAAPEELVEKIIELYNERDRIRFRGMFAGLR